MAHFTKRNNTKEGHLAFYFNRIYTADGMRYHVSVRKDGKSNVFNLESREGRWLIHSAGKIPPWIVELETTLAEIVTAHLNEPPQERNR